MMVDCDKNMIVALLRNWRPNRLLPEGVRLARDRKRLMARQNDLCPLCSKLLADNGKETHIDHDVSVQEFAEKVCDGVMTFDDAYRKLWDDSNCRAVHSRCNYARNGGATAVDEDAR